MTDSPCMSVGSESVMQEEPQTSAPPQQLNADISCPPQSPSAIQPMPTNSFEDKPGVTTLVSSVPGGRSSPTLKTLKKPAGAGHEVSSLSESDAAPPGKSIGNSQSLGWIPSILRLGPLVGLLALSFSALQVFASYAVLKGSDGDAVENWKYQPTVYLAILTAISNKALAFAMVQGTVITFWLRALRGTTLVQLHSDWAVGLHAWKAIVGTTFNLTKLPDNTNALQPDVILIF